MELQAQGERLLYRPRAAVAPALRAELEAHKPAVLAGLRSLRDLAEGPVLAERREPVAWRLYSRVLRRELWLARDGRTRDELAGEHPGTPVLLLEEAARLRGMPTEFLRAVLEVQATFPDARVQA